MRRRAVKDELIFARFGVCAIEHEHLDMWEHGERLREALHEDHRAEVAARVAKANEAGRGHAAAEESSEDWVITDRHSELGRTSEDRTMRTARPKIGGTAHSPPRSAV